MMRMVILCSAVLLACAGVCVGESNVDPAADARYAWSENAGWCDAYANGTHGVAVTPAILSGYVWCENVGWLNLGDGAPDGGGQYSNTTAADCGVNHDGAGNLSGYAWGENIGWVVFDTSGAGGSQVSITPAGAFAGYAWAENIGWIDMGSGYGLQLADSDDDGIPDAFETDTEVFVSAYDTGTDPGDDDTDDDGLDDGDEVNGTQGYVTNPLEEDTDGDTYNDLAEILAGTNPTDPGDHPAAVGLGSLHVPYFEE